MTGSKKEYKTSLSIFLTGLLNVKQTQVALASQNDADKLAQCHIGIASCMTGDGGGGGGNAYGKGNAGGKGRENTESASTLKLTEQSTVFIELWEGDGTQRW